MKAVAELAPVARPVAKLSGLKVKIFADGADIAGMLEMHRDPTIEGFTTNPTLMRKAGVRNYEGFARDVLSVITDRPISLEVFADDLCEIERQARTIAGWGRNVYVKVPVTNTRRESTAGVVERLSGDGIQVNVTALTTIRQVREVAAAIRGGAPAYVSVFAGRIADTGRDPVPMMAAAVEMLGDVENGELIWASPRELLNVMQADAVGCHIITATHDILKKIRLLGKDLAEYSLETVEMFYSDALASGYRL
jgi:transaldolase